MRLILFMFAFILTAAAAASADESADYERDVKPIFLEKCAACHGALRQEAGLRLDAGVLIRQGGDDGPVLIPGRAAESRLLERVTAADAAERMPPEGDGEALNAEQLAVLTAWINRGATSPDAETIPEDPRRHWAYQPPQRPPLPPVDDPRWSHPIDRLIAAEHRKQGLEAVDVADPYTLLRRAYADLIGLPPTREQLDEFIQDPSAGAWAKNVDELLENPHHGERWGRHWMDVWRYSDWDGYKNELRGSQRHIWHWRDWIVESLNQDKGYDRMIVEMLAADEVAPDDPSVLPATGFLARNFHKSNRNIWLDATVEHTAKAFLGMTLDCARCHDHKYDPLAQAEYYRFRAIFEPHQVRTERLPGQSDLMKDGLPRAYDAELNAQTFLYFRGNEKQPDKNNPLPPAVPAVLGGDFSPESVELPLVAFYPALQQFAGTEDLERARQQLAAADKQLNAAQQRPAGDSGSAAPDLELISLTQRVADLRVRTLQARMAADRAKFFGSASAEQPADGHEPALMAAASERQLNVLDAELTVLQKQRALESAESAADADAKKKQSTIESAQKAVQDAEKQLADARTALGKTDDKYTPLGTEYPRTSTGRRLALARWITASENPLTARVAVNHIWLRHFGAPLVENVFDFGLRSPRPVHADLLDWLAVELMEHNWSMKHLHRLIVTSRTWQLASSAGVDETPALESDPDNQLLWRANVQRLDAEIIRDSVLAVSGRLDATLGGADIDFNEGETSRRRSIYLRHAYEKQMTMLVLFDAASPNECYQRSQSIVPQQALALSNSSLALSQSRLLARQLAQETADAGEMNQTEFVRQAFLQILSRPPADEELKACLDFLAEQGRTLSDVSRLQTYAGGTKPIVPPAADPHARARENLVHVLMNHNDFVTIR